MILVTGATGTIGTEVVRGLSARGGTTTPEEIRAWLHARLAEASESVH